MAELRKYFFGSVVKRLTLNLEVPGSTLGDGHVDFLKYFMLSSYIGAQLKNPRWLEQEN